MKARRTHYSNKVYRLAGGTEDNDLWVHADRTEDDAPILRSCWVPTPEERQAIADGCNIELLIWGTGHPPVAMDVVNYPLGKAPEAPE